ncbi:hypothetical protein CcCBS67573_g00355 [Chytriomyces confervae]|uniref:Uncharacterized protein n=1 Tax=Chytriomyces confervae TaxID=246404 RepID=A0A507FPP4_9FUNG|nr:hypothetical protein CcCBS67573_g00355 [Chytriomyces confervae]
MLQTQRIANGKVLRLGLNAPPVNALTRTMIADIRKEIRAANAPGSDVKGLLLASNLPKIFSAGLDLTSFRLSQSNTREHIAEYVHSFEGLFHELAASHVPTATAVHGACPAGGTVVALCTDYRVASSEGPRFSMGINESRVGLVPNWIHPLLRSTLVSVRMADRLSQTGQLATTQKEALSLGFLDTVLEGASPEAVEADAVEKLLELGEQIPWNARVSAKLGARKELIHALKEGDPALVDWIMGPWFQDIVEKLMSQLKKKKNKD